MRAQIIRNAREVFENAREVFEDAREAFEKEWLRALRRRARRDPKSGPSLEGHGVPADPNRPNNLTGGAAAALEFDE